MSRFDKKAERKNWSPDKIAKRRRMRKRVRGVANFFFQAAKVIPIRPLGGAIMSVGEGIEAAVKRDEEQDG